MKKSNVIEEIMTIDSSGIITTIDEVEAEICRKSFFEFLKAFWGEVVAEEPIYNWHVEYLCQELQKVGESIVQKRIKEYDVLINIPPGTTKSTVSTIAFPAWLWTRDQTIRIISNSYSSDISTEHSVKSRDIIMSEKYMRMFPEVRIRKDKAGKQSYDTTKGGARYSTSTGGAITGKHAHVIINDDPQNPQQAASEAHRKQAVDHTKTLSSRKVNKEIAVTITIMQRLNTEDVSGYILGKKSDSIKHIKLPAELRDNCRPIPEDEVFEGKTILQRYQDNDNLLDPVRLSRKVMSEAKVDLGSRGYAGQYDQNPTVEEGDIIKKEWFDIVSLSEYQRRKREYSSIQFFMDTAFTAESENDPTGIIAVDKIGNKMYIVAREKVRKEMPDLIRWIPQWVKTNGYDNGSMIRIEPKANGLSVVQTLRELTKLNVTTTPSPKEGKKTRLYTVSPKVEARRVVLVEGVWNQEFIDEVAGFPNMPHDEDVDLLYYAIDEMLKDYGDAEAMQNILW